MRFALIFLALTGASIPSQALGAPLRARPAADVCRTLQGSLFSFSERGAVFISAIGGGTACRLSPSLAAKEPHLSPDGRAIAFLSGVGTGGNGAGATNSVRMLSLGGRREEGQLSIDGQLHGSLAWSPDGRALAFLDGNSLWVWRVSCECSSPAVRGSSQDPVRSFAWSTDSRHVAAFRQPQSQFPIARVPLYELDVRTGAVSTVWVDFPAGIGNPRTGAGSYPSRLLGWTATNRFLVGTSGWGIGVALTGVWSAPASGGRAQLVLGARSHGYGVSGTRLLNADAALLSPSGRRLLIDSDRRFWVGTTGGRPIRWSNPGISRSCQITQFSWESDAAVAFVSICTTGTKRLFSSLYTLSMSSGVLAQTAQAHSEDQNVPSVAPRVRCVVCGAG